MICQVYRFFVDGAIPLEFYPSARFTWQSRSTIEAKNALSKFNGIFNSVAHRCRTWPLSSTKFTHSYLCSFLNLKIPTKNLFHRVLTFFFSFSVSFVQHSSLFHLRLFHSDLDVQHLKPHFRCYFRLSTLPFLTGFNIFFRQFRSKICRPLVNLAWIIPKKASETPTSETARYVM